MDVPVAVAVNEAIGDFYVLDQANGRVERFSFNGDYLGAFDGSGDFEVEGVGKTGAKPSTGQFSSPRSIAIDNSCAQLKLTEPACKAQDPSNANVYVTDFGHEVVDKFTGSGEYVGQLQLPSVGSFLELMGVAVDAQGNVWLAEDQGLEHRGFDKFDDALQNKFVGFVDDEGIRFRESHPGLAVGREGSLFGDTAFESPFEEVISKFSPTGAALGVILRRQSRGVAVEWKTGDLYLDNVNSIGRFTPSLPSSELERFGEGGEGGPIDGRGLSVDSVVVPGREGQVYVADAGAADVNVYPLEGPKPPTVEKPSVSNVTSESATLQATVNPRGAPSEYMFEYGVCSGSLSSCSSSTFEVTAPANGERSVGGALDFESRVLIVHPQSLLPGTIYHFKVRVRNEKNAPGDFVDSGEVAFKTQPTTPVEHLLDGRGWEMVSPPKKHGTLIRQLLDQGVIQAAAGGAAVTYETDTPTGDEPHGFSNFVQVLSRRKRGGWTSEDIALSHLRATGQSIGAGEEYRLFSEDLSIGLVQPLGAFEPATSPEASEQTPYARIDFANEDVETPCSVDCYRPLASLTNVPEGVRFGEEGSCPPRLICGPSIKGASADGRHVIVGSSVGLTPTPEDNGGLYEWTDGTLSLVSVLPNNRPASPSSGHELGGAGITRGAVSTDGSSVVWTGKLGSSLYLREVNSNRTFEVNNGLLGTPEYEAASADGSRVFFVVAGELYVYEVEKEKASRLTFPLAAEERTDVQGRIAGVSEDGSYVYFVADGRLDEKAPPAEHQCEGSSIEVDLCYMYVLHNAGGVWSTPKLVAVLSGADLRDFSNGLTKSTVRVSPNGRWLVFMSQLSLTGYDNRDAVSGARDEEVFLYDATAEKLICVSCDPSGARPDGVEYHQLEERNSLVGGDRVWAGETWLAANVPGWTPYELDESFYQSRYLLDDGRVFFNSSDALVPGDVNGTEDVYEFEPVGVGSCSTGSPTFLEARDGCVGLVSAGTSRSESAFLDASSSGGDVFFLTSAQLVPSDSDSAVDVYDAHECSVDAPCIVPPGTAAPACVTEASCKEQPSLQPNVFGLPASSTFTGLGNISPISARSTEGSSSRRLTPKEKLKKALANCRKVHAHARKRRAACERRAWTGFGAKRQG